MKDLKLVLRSNIQDQDLLDMIAPNATAILIDEDGFHIEINDEGFAINDGYSYYKANTIQEAVDFLKQVQIELKGF